MTFRVSVRVHLLPPPNPAVQSLDDRPCPPPPPPCPPPSGSCVSVVVGAPQPVANRCCAAARSQKRGRGVDNATSDAESTLLGGDLGAESSFLGGGDLENFAEAVLEGRAHLLCTEVKAVRSHRAGMVADPVPHWARRPSWVIISRRGHAPHGDCGRSLGDRRRRAGSAKQMSCGIVYVVHRRRKGLGWDVLAHQGLCRPVFF